MTKELTNVVKEYHVNGEYEGIEFDVTVTTNAIASSESDIRVISIDCSIGPALYVWGNVEEYILEMWDKIEEIN